MRSLSNPDIIVVGASAGGVDALRKLAAGLPPGLEGAVFVVLHTLATGENLLPHILSRAGPLPAVEPQDGTLFEIGKIYTAPPDRHLMLHDGSLRVVRGPRENRHRPSIDVLFRSAATAFGPRVAAVLLSGSDDDGTAGMLAVKKSGGVAIVQDPADSDHPEMPASALRAADPDFKLPATEIGPLLRNLVDGRIRPPRTEARIEAAEKSFGQEEGSPTDIKQLGTPTSFSCPDCNGTLWELQDGNLLRYQCRVGHAYTWESVVEAESDAVERALWSAVRTLEESAALSRRVAQRTGLLEQEMARKAAEREEHARVIRHLLLEGSA
ncbi:MAG: chemotaxis protein CheB [Terriglobia bacterium]|nr:MAG: chemotaxis protein CheB [Terriglobia bacterium]